MAAAGFLSAQREDHLGREGVFHEADAITRRRRHRPVRLVLRGEVSVADDVALVHLSLGTIRGARAIQPPGVDGLDQHLVRGVHRDGSLDAGCFTTKVHRRLKTSC